MLKKLFVTILAALALVIGALSPAQATTTADFSAAWNAGSTANAEATGVALAGTDVTGKILLQEERATMSDNDIKRMKPPTKAQIMRYGTVVHSNVEGQQVMTKQITAYDNLVHNVSVKAKKLQVKLKYADSAKEKRVLRQKLRRAQSQLKAIAVDAEWKYRPLIRLTDGCFRNTGRNNLMNLTSFKECIKGDKAEVDLGFDPVEREMRVVGVIYTNGTIKTTPCENFAYFDIPEGTPNEELYVVVDSFATVILTVSVGVRVAGDLTIYGVMRQDGTVCDQDQQTRHVNEFRQLPPVTVKDTDTDSALAFGQRQVQAETDVRAEVQKSVATDIKTNVSLTMHLQCGTPQPTDNPPSMQCQVPQHIFVGDDAMEADFDLTDPDGNPVSFDQPVVTGPIQVVVVEDTIVPGGKRRSVKFSAKDIPAGTSQSATISVSGSANGKPASCSGTVTVTNTKTGWRR